MSILFDESRGCVVTEEGVFVHAGSSVFKDSWRTAKSNYSQELTSRDEAKRASRTPVRECAP